MTVQVPHEVIRTVEVPVPVEQIVEKIVEKIVQVPVPVTRQEHVTRQVVQNCVQNTRAPPRQTDVKVVPGQDYGVPRAVFFSLFFYFRWVSMQPTSETFKPGVRLGS